MRELKHAFAIGPERDDGAPLARPLLRFAEEVVARGMETPAVLLLETLRPLSFLSSQVVLAASPFLKMVACGVDPEELAAALEDRETASRLLDHIERLARERGEAR
jgi:hypothetical protein